MLRGSPSSRAVVLVYLAIGVAWILVSDRVVAFVFRDEGTLAVIETVKGWLFILVTASVLALLLRHRDMTIEEAAEAVHRHESRYRQIVETTHDGVWMLDADGRTTFANEPMAAMVGWTVPEMLGRPMTDFLGNEERPATIAVLARLRNGDAEERDVRLIRRDGSTVWTRQSMNPLLDEENGYQGTLALVSDVSERLAQERRLEFQANVLAHVRDAVIVLDGAGRFVHWSTGATELFGYAEAEAVGRTPGELFEPGAILATLAGDAVAETSLSTDHQLRRRDGSIAWFNARSSAVVDASGAVTARIIVARDVTDRVRAESAALASEQRFRAFMAHSPVEAFMKDAEGRYVYLNAAFVAGNQPQLRPDWMGRRDEELWEPEQAARNVAEDATVLADDAPREFIKSVRAAGGERTLLVYKFPIRDAEDRPYLGGVRIDLTERYRSRDELARLAAAIEQAADAIMVTDAAEQIVFVNAALERLSGYQRSELVGRQPGILRSGEHAAAYYDEMRQAIRDGRAWSGDLIDRRKDGSLYEQNTTISPVVDEAGRLVGWAQVGRDVTHERELEAQLRQAQKMEAVGRLAGGIAHDFNNLLTAIGGYAELLLAELPPDEQAGADAAEILRATDRASQLTRQLLAFGRRQVLQPEVVDLNAIVRGVAPMLRRLIGEDITLLTVLAPDLGRVRADPGQIEQILVNLAVNARDAMPGGGTLTLETANVRRRARPGRPFPPRGQGAGRDAAADELPVDGEVMIAVADTGVGIDEEARQHIFEPFYTTKENGQGTGLGLATVYGIIEQSGGAIELESQPGHGAVFRVRLPRLDGDGSAGGEGEWREDRPIRGSERILLVEDETAVRRLALAALERQGYRVKAAAAPDEALTLAEADPQEIDLLLTDVVMPGMNGPEMADRLRASRPGLRVLFVSGYTEDAVVRRGVLDASVNFLQKPFGPEALARRVREVLDAPPPLRAGGSRRPAGRAEQRGS